MFKFRRIGTVAVLVATLLLCGCTSFAMEKNSEKDSVKLTLVGDLMCQFGQQEKSFDGIKYDFNYQFDYVRDILKSSDLTMGNLEVNISQSEPLGKDKLDKYGNPYLNGPEEFLDALKNTGFDLLANANNHNCDTGVNGLMETLQNQDKYGLLHTGIFDGTEKERFLILDVKGIKIGVASYTSLMNNSKTDFTQNECDTYLNEYSDEKVQKDIAAMRENGAEFVLVYLHTGREYFLKPTEKQMQRVRKTAEAGADYVICSHSHTLQKSTAIQTTDGRTVPVAYSMGNFVSNMFWKNSKYTMILSIELKTEKDQVEIANVGYYPCLLLKENGDTGRIYQVVPCTKDGLAKIKDPEVKAKMKDAREKVIQMVGKEITPFE